MAEEETTTVTSACPTDCVILQNDTWRTEHLPLRFSTSLPLLHVSLLFSHHSPSGMGEHSKCCNSDLTNT